MFLFIWHRIRAALVIAGTVLLAATAQPAETQVLQGHLPGVVARGLAPTGRLPAGQQMRLAIGLPLRNPQALTNLLQQLYDPHSPLYHKFLNPEQFTAAYGPKERDYLAVRRFAESHGLTVTGTYSNRMLLDVTGAVADVEEAFHVQMRVYRHPTEARDFYSPDVEPSVDAGLAIADISGLNNYGLPHPKCLAMGSSPAEAGLTPKSGSGSGGDYMGNDFRAAYAPGVTLTGAGQMVGLVEFDGYYANDIASYEAAAGLPSVPLQNVLLDGYNGTPGSGDAEVSLDIEMAVSMAPGLSSVVVFEAGPSGTPNDVFNAMAASNRISQFSCSWGWDGGPSITADNIFKEMDAQGQSFFDACGDSDAFTTGSSSANGVDNPSTDNTPASCPYISIVGGTTLSTTGPGGSWTSETVWNWGLHDGSYVGTCGGISSHYSIPSWQVNVSMASNGGSSAYRNVPDVALTANNVYLLFGNGSSETVGGTSCAAPLWAAFTALVNQQNEAEGQPPAGFLNPALYAIGLGTNYNACFHDITTGNNTWPDSPNYFYAVNGYDLCTGWGTPAGSNLINVLAAPADALEITPLNGFSASAAPGGPVKVVSQSFVLTNAGTTALDWVLDNPAAWLSNSPSGGTLPAGGSVNVTVSLDATAVAALPAGVYPTNIWFTNVSDGVAQSRQFTLTLAVPQLVQNGGFETGDFTGWTVTGSSGSDDVFVGSADSLAVTTGYGRHKITTYYGSYYIHSGSYAAFLGEPDVLSYLSQNLATDPGQAYLLSFWVDNPGKFVNPPTPNEFMAAWNGNTLLDQVNMGAFSYTNLQFTVEATNASTTLEFGARNDNDYFGLDDISVTPIPTPAFQSAASVGGSITLTWAAMTGVTYQLQYTASLSAPNWSNLGPPITASNGVIATSDNQPADSQRFYRVVLAP